MARVKAQEIPSSLQKEFGLHVQPAVRRKESDKNCYNTFKYSEIWYNTTKRKYHTNYYSKARFPFRMPHMQGLYGAGVTENQRKQRQRVQYVVGKFNDRISRDRWRDESWQHEWHSTLFWYNFFMLEGLEGGGVGPGHQMIKSIQHKDFQIPVAGGVWVDISTVDPDKVIVLMNGNSYRADITNSSAYAVPVYPRVALIYATSILFNWSFTPDEVAMVSADIVEYI